MHVRLADDDRALQTQTRRQGGILARHAVAFGVVTRTQTGWESSDIEAIFNRNRHAVEKWLGSVRKSSRQLVRLFPHFLGIGHHVNIVAGIAVGARERFVSCGARRDISAGELLGKLLQRASSRKHGHVRHSNRIHHAATDGISRAAGNVRRRKQEQQLGWPPFLLLWARLKLNAERHLNLARAADGLVHDAQAKRAVVETIVRGVRAAVGQRRRPLHGRVVVILVLRNVIERKVEAGSVGQVKDIEGVLQHHTLGDIGVLHDGEVRRLCQVWRKMLRCPVVKLVSKVSPAGIAPFKSPGESSGRVKQLELSAYCGFREYHKRPFYR